MGRKTACSQFSIKEFGVNFDKSVRDNRNSEKKM